MDFWCFGAACFFAGLALSWLLFWLEKKNHVFSSRSDVLAVLAFLQMLAAIILIVLNAIRLLGI